MRNVSKTDIPDAPSGFRALTRDAAMKLNVFNNYTYTLETIIQAGRKNMAITWVDINVNEDLRPSRLVKSILSYIQKSLITIVRIFMIYEPFTFFMRIGLITFITGLLIGLRYIYYMFTGDGSGHVQSLILSSILLVMGFQTMITAFIADLLSANRKLLEDIQYRIKKKE